MFVLKNAFKALIGHKKRAIAMFFVAFFAAFASVSAACVSGGHDKYADKIDNTLTTEAFLRRTEKKKAEYTGSNSEWTKTYLTDAVINPLLSTADSFSFAESVPVRSDENSKSVAEAILSDDTADKTGGELTFKSFKSPYAQFCNSYGKFEIIEGKDLSCASMGTAPVLVSEAFAAKNNLKVDSSFTVGDGQIESKKHELTVGGIYRYTEEADKSAIVDTGYRKDNRENVIYAEYYTFYSGWSDDETTGWDKADIDLNIVFTGVAKYENMLDSAKKDGIVPDGYEFYSPSLEKIKDERNRFNKFAGIAKFASIAIFVVSFASFAYMTVTFSTKLRKKEIANNFIVGYSSLRLSGQFMIESLMFTVPSAVLGVAAAGLVSKCYAGFAGNIEDVSTAITADIIRSAALRGTFACFVLAVFAAFSIKFFDKSSLFEARSEER